MIEAGPGRADLFDTEPVEIARGWNALMRLERNCHHSACVMPSISRPLWCGVDHAVITCLL